MMNSVPTPVLVGGATFRVGGVVRSFEECVGAFQKMAGTASCARRAAIEHEVACGTFLIECRACMDRLVWGRFLQRIGVNQKTALRQVTMAMKIGATAQPAGARAGGRGKSVVDWAKFEACVLEWNARNPEGSPLHIKAGAVSLHRAQVVVGARPIADFSRTGTKISQTEWVRETQPERGGERGGSGPSKDMQDRVWAGGSTVVNSSLSGVGVHNAPASFSGAGGVQPLPVAGSLLSSPAVPVVKDRGAGFDRRPSAQMSLADEYEAVQAERLRLEAMLAEIVGLVQVSGGGGVDVRGALARIGGDVEGLLRSVRGS